jgi:hypothetical protein
LPRLRRNRYKAFGFDSGLWALMSLSTFTPKTSREKEVLTIATAVAQSYGTPSPRSLVLTSPFPSVLSAERAKLHPKYTGCGNGKTHLAVALAKQALDIDRSVMFVSETTMLEDIKRSYDTVADPAKADVLGAMDDAWLVVIDDVGSANVKSPDWYVEIMYRIVDTQYRTNRPLILTTNLGEQALSIRFGTRIMSRLNQMAYILFLDGPDRRTPTP